MRNYSRPEFPPMREMKLENESMDLIFGGKYEIIIPNQTFHRNITKNIFFFASLGCFEMNCIKVKLTIFSNKITSGKMGFIIWNNIWKYALPPTRLSNKDYTNFHPKKGLKEVKGSLHGACYLQ